MWASYTVVVKMRWVHVKGYSHERELPPVAPRIAYYVGIVMPSRSNAVPSHSPWEIGMPFLGRYKPSTAWQWLRLVLTVFPWSVWQRDCHVAPPIAPDTSTIDDPRPEAHSHPLTPLHILIMGSGSVETSPPSYFLSKYETFLKFTLLLVIHLWII